MIRKKIQFHVKPEFKVRKKLTKHPGKKKKKKKISQIFFFFFFFFFFKKKKQETCFMG